MIEAGVATRIGSGDFFAIPPGYDAYVDGAERVELVLFAPPQPQHWSHKVATGRNQISTPLHGRFGHAVEH